MLGGTGEEHNPLDEVGNVTEATGLAAIPIDCERLAVQGLHEEVGDNPAVAGVQAWAVGVEDAGTALNSNVVPFV